MIKIMVVDDEQEAVDAIKPFLEMFGYKVATALNGSDAIKSIAKENPQIMLLDLNLKDISGLKVLKEAISFNPKMKVAVISGFNDPALFEKSIALGAYEYIVKPISLSELKEKINSIVSKSRLENEAG